MVKLLAAMGLETPDYLEGSALRRARLGRVAKEFARVKATAGMPRSRSC
jgi:hypothetical protein